MRREEERKKELFLMKNKIAIEKLASSSSIIVLCSRMPAAVGAEKHTRVLLLASRMAQNVTIVEETPILLNTANNLN